MTASTHILLLTHIQRQGPGKVFTPKDFLDVGSRDAVDQALSRLAKQGSLERLARGLYHYPRINSRLQIPVTPDTDEIAAAIARQTGSRIAPSGAMAANRLGLSTQVPAKPIYVTDGRSKQVRVGERVDVFRHVSPKVLTKLRRALPPNARAQLLEDARFRTDWIAQAVRRMAGQDK